MVEIVLVHADVRDKARVKSNGNRMKAHNPL